jgi:hypothetical protein
VISPLSWKCRKVNRANRPKNAIKLQILWRPVPTCADQIKATFKMKGSTSNYIWASSLQLKIKDCCWGMDGLINRFKSLEMIQLANKYNSTQPTKTKTFYLIGHKQKNVLLTNVIVVKMIRYYYIEEKTRKQNCTWKRNQWLTQLYTLDVIVENSFSS